MARYVALFAIQVEHEFFAGDLTTESLALEFIPDKTSAAMMQRENLLLRRSAKGIEIWQESRDTVRSSIDSDSSSKADLAEAKAPLDFVFLVSASDPMFNFYTAWERAKPVKFFGTNFGANSATNNDTNSAPDHVDEHQQSQTLQMSTTSASDFGLSSFERQRAAIVFSVELQHRPMVAMSTYVIRLQAKALHWKYYFCGALAKKQLQIVDLDRENEAVGTTFHPSTQVVGSNGQAFISDAALPMRSIPSQRFQLREADATGRVLMRRLPNASIQKIGKEGSPDGQSLVVAEIYIHQ